MANHPTEYTMSIGTERVTLDVSSGRYIASRFWFDYWSQATVAELQSRWNDVHEGERDNKRYRELFRGLPKHAKAAMVADWEGLD